MTASESAVTEIILTDQSGTHALILCHSFLQQFYRKLSRVPNVSVTMIRIVRVTQYYFTKMLTDSSWLRDCSIRARIKTVDGIRWKIRVRKMLNGLGIRIRIRMKFSIRIRNRIMAGIEIRIRIVGCSACWSCIEKATALKLES